MLNVATNYSCDVLKPSCSKTPPLSSNRTIAHWEVTQIRVVNQCLQSKTTSQGKNFYLGALILRSGLQKLSTDSVKRKVKFQTLMTSNLTSTMRLSLASRSNTYSTQCTVRVKSLTSTGQSNHRCSWRGSLLGTIKTFKFCKDNHSRSNGLSGTSANRFNKCLWSTKWKLIWWMFLKKLKGLSPHKQRIYSHIKSSLSLTSTQLSMLSLKDEISLLLIVSELKHATFSLNLVRPRIL